MKSLVRHGGLLLLLLLCWLPAASGQTSLDRVAKIVVTNVGPAAASEELVRANIHVKVGDPYVRASADDDVRNLYETGYFFDIQVTAKLGDGGIILTYMLQGKLKLTNIKFEGNTRFSNAKLLKKVTSKIGEPLDERKLFSDTLEIQKMYEKSGQPHTTVKYVLNNFDENAGRSGVTFEIKESAKIRIVEVDFPGATSFTQRKLRKVVKTRKHWMFSWLTSSGTFKQDQFEDDQEKLADFYRNEGYIDFELVTTNFTYPTPRTMKVQFVVSEGKQYRVGSVTFKGTNTLWTPQEIAAGLKRQHGLNRSKTKIGENGLEADVGMVFKPEALEHDIRAVEDLYGAKGYIDVKEHTRNLDIKRIPNTESGQMDLEYTINSGQKSYIHKIEIRGNSKTKDRVIRRELLVSPGEVFDMVRVERTKERLEGMGFFERVDTRAELDPTLEPWRKDLIVSVDEKSTGQFSFGAGFNTVEGLEGFAQVEQSNFDIFNPPYFTGGGQKFRLRVSLGTELQNYELAFTEPWFLNRKLRLDIDLYHTVASYVSLNNLYDQANTGARFGLTRALGSDFLIGGVNYSIEGWDIFNVSSNAPNTILRQQGHSLYNRFGASLAYDTRNNTALPNKGQFTQLLGSLVVGSQTYWKSEIGSSWYFKGFAPGHVLELVGHFRLAERIGSQDLPFFDRYYLGGQYDLRGYDYRAVGPREVTQDGGAYEPIGGDTSWFSSAEYSIPIGIPRLRFAVFYDIGNVSARPFSFTGSEVIGNTRENPIPPPPFSTPGIFGHFPAGNTGTYSDNYGIGLRLDLPIGPLRLDYGIPIHHDPFTSSSGKFQFGVGFARPF
jgi:outer membrane protein insertion porin family